MARAWGNEFHSQSKGFDEVAVSISLAGGSPIHIVL
jgi:hypothetical protein